MFDVGDFRSNCIQARFDGERRKSAEVFMTIQALLGNGELHLSIQYDRGGGIGVKHVKAQNEHELRLSP
jgi:hypothetical protein